MRPRPATPAQGSVVTVRAKSHGALMSATAKRVEALKEDHQADPVLVVYGAGNAAHVFCEQHNDSRRKH